MPERDAGIDETTVGIRPAMCDRIIHGGDDLPRIASRLCEPSYAAHFCNLPAGGFYPVQGRGRPLLDALYLVRRLAARLEIDPGLHLGYQSEQNEQDAGQTHRGCEQRQRRLDQTDMPQDI